MNRKYNSAKVDNAVDDRITEGIENQVNACGFGQCLHLYMPKGLKRPT